VSIGGVEREGKHETYFILHILHASAFLVERKTKEEPCNNIQYYFTDYVVGTPPVDMEDALLHSFVLGKPRNGVGTLKLVVLTCTSGSIVLRFDSDRFINRCLPIKCVLPYICPVAVRLCCGSSPNYLEDIFRWIVISLALDSTIPFKVVNDILRVLSDITKVDCSSAFL
jgi:hypothetical protein